MSTTTKKTTTKKKEVLNLHQRLNLVREQLSQPLVKESMVHNQYSAVTHDQITGAVRDLLTKFGISTCHDVETYTRDNNFIVLKGITTYYNVDNPDDKLTLGWYGEGVDRGDKGLGKAWSYGLKYHYAKMFGILSGDQDEVDQHISEYKPSGSGKIANSTVVSTNESSSESQREQIRKLISDVSEFDPDVFDNMMSHFKKEFGISNITDMSRSMADTCIQHLKNKIAQQGGA